MTMSVDHDQDVHANFMLENQSWSDLTNSENVGESSKQKLDMISLKHKEVINEEEVFVNKKQSQGGVVIRSENDITNGEGKYGKYRNTNHEMHILTEREKRKKMSNMFSSLHALLPELPSKADKSTIVDAAVKKIKDLHQILENLEKKKKEKEKYVSLFESETSFVISKSQWHPYESREIVIASQGFSSYNNNLPTSAIASSYPNSNALSLFAPPPQQIAFQTWSSDNVVLKICGGEAQFCICATKMSCIFTTIVFLLEKHMIDVVSANIMCNRSGNFYMILAHARQCLNDPSSLEETYKHAAQEILMWIS